MEQGKALQEQPNVEDEASEGQDVRCERPKAAGAWDEDIESEGAGSCEPASDDGAWYQGMTPQQIGRRGEQAAARYLDHMGYIILERNWQCPAGEVDIVALDEGALVFCEVKTRTNLDCGLPEEAVDARKRNRYEKIAGWYLRDHDFVDMPVRFDIVALLAVSNERALVRHLVNAFAAVQ